MTTTGTHETYSPDDEEDPMPIELAGVGALDESYECCSSCWYLLSWVVSLILYTVECFVTVWVAYTYATNRMYVQFGLSLGYLTIPLVIIITASLIWYYNLDRFHRKKKESDPHNLAHIEYQNKFNAASVICHVLLLGMIYRYAQIVYLVMIRKKEHLPYLRRDTTYLRLIHSLIMSAPLVIVHLYTISLYLPNCLNPTSTLCSIFEHPSVYAALAASLASLLYSILAFATNDRLSGKRRRVIFSAHLTQILWYICMLTSRMLAIVLFAYAYQHYVFAFIGGHWIVMFLFLLIQRTTFCADVIKQSNSNVKIRRRWCLEIAFDFVAASMYIFAFFNVRKGKSRFWSLFFHLLMYAEIVTMSALYYVRNNEGVFYVFSLTVLTLTLGLYPVGVLFMMTYYLFFHPRKTIDWYWIGFPKRKQASITRTGFRNRTPTADGRIDISGPTLVAHNGFIPQTMLPDGVPSSPAGENGMVTDPAQIISQSRRSMSLEERRENGNRLVENWVIPRSSDAQNNRNLVTSLTMVSPTSTGNVTTLPSESLPALSDVPSQFGPSDIDTDVGSGVLHVPQGEIGGDTVIDTPLSGTTPDPTLQTRLRAIDFNEPASGTIRSLTDTVDTGIDLGADTPLTDPHDGNDYNREDMNMSIDIDLPHFSDIPAKRQGYLRKKSPLETHYFPEKPHKRSRESLTPTLPTPVGYSSSYSPGSTRALLGHNSSGESGEVYQPKMKSSVSSSKEHQHHVLPLAMSTPERTRRNNAPRSPKGARAFTIVPGDDDKPPALSRTRVKHSSSYPSQNKPPVEAQFNQSPQRLRAPRSPKGARRMLVQPENSKPNKTVLGMGVPSDPPSNRNSFTSVSYNRTNSARSPERLPRGVSNYQRQSSGSFQGVFSSKTPDGLRRNIPRHQVVQKSYSTRVQGSAKSPERQPRGVSNYKREVPNMQQKQYIQQQQQNRSRWDRWAAEQEQKRRQSNTDQSDSGLQSQHSFTPSHASGGFKSSRQSSYSPKHKVNQSKSYPSQQSRFSSIEQSTPKRKMSEEFDHLIPRADNISSSQHENMTDGASSINEAASIAPQAYPRAPQGARGKAPRMAWSPPRKDQLLPPRKERLSLSPQRSVPGMGLLHHDSMGAGALSASCRIPRAPDPSASGKVDAFRLSSNLASSSSLYVPTASTHQSVV